MSMYKVSTHVPLSITKASQSILYNMCKTFYVFSENVFHLEGAVSILLSPSSPPLDSPFLIPFSVAGVFNVSVGPFSY